MAYVCAFCGSHETQALTDRYQCLMCGKTTDYQGEKLFGPGPAGTQEIKVRDIK